MSRSPSNNSTDLRSKTATPSGRDGESAPLGVKIVCALGVLGILAGIVAAFALAGQIGGAPGTVVAVVVLAVVAGQAAAIYGLLAMEPWGWTLAVALYGLNAFVNLVTANVVGLVVALVVVGYLFTVEDQYE